MKLHFVKILLILIISGCMTNKEKIQKTWIARYDINEIEPGDERIGYLGTRRIFQFEKDSLIIKGFKVSYPIGDTDKFSIPYRLKENRILFKEHTSFIHHISEDSLVLFPNPKYQRLVVYEELKRFNQADNENELYELITTNTFSIQDDTIQIEFRKDGRFVLNNFEIDSGYKQPWVIEKFENELFLVLDEILGGIFQVKEINADKIIGKLYWIDNKESIFNKVQVKNGFEISQIIGEWKPKENPTPHLTVQDKEALLKISESKIISFDGVQRDTFNWEMNRSKNIMILENSQSKWSPAQWNILSIKNDILTLKRKREYKDTSGKRIEVVKFKRKK